LTSYLQRALILRALSEKDIDTDKKRCTKKRISRNAPPDEWKIIRNRRSYLAKLKYLTSHQLSPKKRSMEEKPRRCSARRLEIPQRNADICTRPPSGAAKKKQLQNQRELPGRGRNNFTTDLRFYDPFHGWKWRQAKEKAQSIFGLPEQQSAPTTSSRKRGFAR